MLRCALLLWTLLVGCAGTLRTDRAFTDARPLVDLVPPGPAWVVQARPRALAEQDAARTLFRALVTEERERAFAERTGIDALRVEELVAFEVPPNGYVFLVRGPFDARKVVVSAGERLALHDVVSDAPLVRREGLAGQGRYAYAALAANAVLVAKDVPPDMTAQILARRTDTKAPRLLDPPDARALYAEHAASPFVLFAPQPLALEPGTNVALLFARERALAVTVRPTHAVLGVSVDLRGEFPPGAEHNFRALAQSLASAQLGRALGLGRVPETMAVRVDARGAYVTFAVEVSDLLAGVRMLFFDDMRELFSGLRRGPAGATCSVHGEAQWSVPGRRSGSLSGARRGRGSCDRIQGNRGESQGLLRAEGDPLRDEADDPVRWRRSRGAAGGR